VRGRAQRRVFRRRDPSATRARRTSRGAGRIAPTRARAVSANWGAVARPPSGPAPRQRTCFTGRKAVRTPSCGHAPLRRSVTRDAGGGCTAVVAGLEARKHVGADGMALLAAPALWDQSAAGAAASSRATLGPSTTTQRAEIPSLPPPERVAQVVRVDVHLRRLKR
jgi:hypothetical protein